MASPTIPAPARQAPAPVGTFGRLFGVFFEPKSTFQSIVRRPTFVVPIIVLWVIGGVVIGLFGQRVGWRTYMERQDTMNSRTQAQMQKLTPAQREHMLEQQTKYAPIGGYGFVTVGSVIVWLIVAALFMGVFNLLLGADIKFSASFAIVVFAWLPWVIHGLLGILILFLKDPSTVDLQNLVASNPGTLLSNGAPLWLASGLGAIDIFSFWTMALLAVGYTAASPKKLSFWKAFGCVFAVWIVYVLIIKIGLVAIVS